MADEHGGNRGGISWYVRLLLDPRSRKKVEEDLKKTGQTGGKGLGEEAGKGVDKGIRESLQSTLRYVKGTFGLLLAREIGNALRTAGEAIVAFVRRGGELDRVRESFEALTASAGLTGRTVLEEMRKASRGMVADLELMRQANMALQVGLPVTAEGMGELVLLSRRLAEATGGRIGAAEALDRMVKGIGKLEIELLDELGLLGGVNGALREYTRQTGKSVQDLDQAARVQLYYAATVEEARKKVAAMGEDQLDVAERLDQVTTFWNNLTSAVALAVVESPRIASFFDTIGIGAKDAGDRVQELADRVGAFVDAYGGRLAKSLTGIAVGAATGAGIGAISTPFVGGLGAAPGAIVGALTGGVAGWWKGREGDVGSYEAHLARRQAERILDEMNRGGGMTIPLAPTPDAAALENARKQAQKIMEAFDEEVRKRVRIGLAGRGANIGGVALSEEGRARSLAERQRREDFTAMGGRLMPVAPFEESALTAYSDRYLETMATIEAASQGAAWSIATAFSDTFSRMITEGESVGDALADLPRRLAAGLIQGLAQHAAVKVAENVAAAFEQYAKAAAAAASPLTAPLAVGYTAAAQAHLVAAAKWGGVGLGAGIAGAAVGGGAYGPRSSYDRGLDRTERMDGRGTEVHIYLDQLSPADPRFQRVVYGAQQQAQRRFGKDARVYVHPHRG